MITNVNAKRDLAANLLFNGSQSGIIKDRILASMEGVEGKEIMNNSIVEKGSTTMRDEKKGDDRNTANKLHL